eukprot:CAMPEP_0113936630 /NCGR_PEP_ID=MMETSP1339-20121228/3492_1 /TAXON_ID=94617 /ORGANISM="Fibrocapsa japonica" /LENGTH=532 /DNA_ID=CAMNT_0000939161 /DNA_START=82 /DNA_END=1680 /DNA_ORIENTATION=- /assembly_acc=CAM_ASM_000762
MPRYCIFLAVLGLMLDWVTSRPLRFNRRPLKSMLNSYFRNLDEKNYDEYDKCLYQLDCEFTQAQLELFSCSGASLPTCWDHFSGTECSVIVALDWADMCELSPDPAFNSGQRLADLCPPPPGGQPPDKHWGLNHMSAEEDHSSCLQAYVATVSAIMSQVYGCYEVIDSEDPEFVAERESLIGAGKAPAEILNWACATDHRGQSCAAKLGVDPYDAQMGDAIDASVPSEQALIALEGEGGRGIDCAALRELGCCAGSAASWDVAWAEADPFFLLGMAACGTRLEDHCHNFPAFEPPVVLSGGLEVDPLPEWAGREGVDGALEAVYGILSSALWVAMEDLLVYRAEIGHDHLVGISRGPGTLVVQYKVVFLEGRYNVPQLLEAMTSAITQREIESYWDIPEQSRDSGGGAESGGVKLWVEGCLPTSCPAATVCACTHQATLQELSPVRRKASLLRQRQAGRGGQRLLRMQDQPQPLPQPQDHPDFFQGHAANHPAHNWYQASKGGMRHPSFAMLDCGEGMVSVCVPEFTSGGAS